MLQLGFTASRCDPSLFVYSKGPHVVYMLVYVDDIIVTGNNQRFIQHLVLTLKATFSFKDLGTIAYFLGIEVKRELEGSLVLTRGTYICDILQKRNLHEAHFSTQLQ